MNPRSARPASTCSATCTELPAVSTVAVSGLTVRNAISHAGSRYSATVRLAAILSWLVAFNVVNTNNRVVLTIGDMLYRITEPALRPIRNILPNLGGIDISPVILILLLLFIRDVVLLGWIAPAFVATPS